MMSLRATLSLSKGRVAISCNLCHAPLVSLACPSTPFVYPVLMGHVPRARRCETAGSGRQDGRYAATQLLNRRGSQ
jgi:hypothetical protein